MVTRIALGCDDIGLALLNVIREYLATQNVQVKDFGIHPTEPVDSPMWWYKRRKPLPPVNATGLSWFAVPGSR
jgi:hypothetical protein